jgi:hypothetical protein
MKTITRDEISTLAMTSGGEKKLRKVIDGGVVWLWVGIGWVDEGPPTPQQKRRLHHVIETPKEASSAVEGDSERRLA